MKTTKVLIIGHQGMLGQALLKVFTQAVGVDREELDITSQLQVEKILNKLKPNVVINTAAYNNVDDCETVVGFKRAQNINDKAVGYLAKVCLDMEALFIHYSTGYVFDGQQKSGYAESDKPKPINKYAQTKWAGERHILQYNKLKHYIIRTSKLFGPAGISPLAKTSFFDLILHLSNNKEELEVVDDELSNFTYTPDLAQATKILLSKHYSYGTYHIINENPATWFRGAQVLFDILGSNVKLKAVKPNKFKRLAKRPKYDVLLNSKFPKLRNYEDALREYLDYQKL